MKCENIQFDLPIYADDRLSADECAAIEAHLAACPLCRQALADFQTLKNDLRALPRPAAMPADLLAATRALVAREIKQNRRAPDRILSEARREWLQMRLMPYGAATLITFVFGLSLLWTLLSATKGGGEEMQIARAEQPFVKSTVMLAENKSANDAFNPELGATDFAAARLPITNQSPAVNPNGALVALTKSLVRGNIKDDEVVVVADVFGNGLAKIAEVVEPSSDRRAVAELENALNNNPDFAPFLPASVDGRSDTVRVVLKFQRVDVKIKGKR